MVKSGLVCQWGGDKVIPIKRSSKSWLYHNGFAQEIAYCPRDVHDPLGGTGMNDWSYRCFPIKMWIIENRLSAVTHPPFLVSLTTPRRRFTSDGGFFSSGRLATGSLATARLPVGHRPVIGRSPSGYRSVIVWLSVGYHPVISQSPEWRLRRRVCGTRTARRPVKTGTQCSARCAGPWT